MRILVCIVLAVIIVFVGYMTYAVWFAPDSAEWEK